MSTITNLLLVLVLSITQATGLRNIHRCPAGRTEQVFHLCEGDVIQCRNENFGIQGRWNVTSLGTDVGILQLRHRVIIMDITRKMQWTLGCYQYSCIIDFLCANDTFPNPIVRTDQWESAEENTVEIGTLQGSGLKSVPKRSPVPDLASILEPMRNKGENGEDRMAGITGGKGNLFLQVHSKLFLTRNPVCYPPPESVDALFTLTPTWDPYSKLLWGVPTPLPQKIRFPYSYSLPANCLQLNQASPHSYEQCYNGSGYGCRTVYVPSNITCLTRVCSQRICHNEGISGSCSCVATECVPLTEGIQLLCGDGNQTHLTINSHSFLMTPFNNGLMTHWWAEGPSLNLKNTWHQLWTKPGYFLLFNGWATNFVKAADFPKLAAIGTLVPTTVPCPGKWIPTRRLVARAVSAEFCESWKNPSDLASTRGDVAGWGILSAITLGGVAGAVAVNNRNYLICGLTLLGNRTLEALEVITQELSELRLFTMQNRYALDYMLAREGGVCAIVKGKCIMGVQDQTANLTRIMNRIRTQLDGMSEGTSWGEWGYGGWTDWIINMAMYLVIGVICIFIGMAVLKMMVHKLQSTLEGIGTPKMLLVRSEELEAEQRAMLAEMERQRMIYFEDPVTILEPRPTEKQETSYHEMIKGGNVGE